MRWFEPKGFMRAFLAIVLLGAFMGGLMMVVNYAVPEGNEQLVTYMLGQLSALAGLPVAFYFGTNKDQQEQWDRIHAEPTSSTAAGSVLPNGSEPLSERRDELVLTGEMEDDVR